MQALVWEGPRQMVMREVEQPQPKPDEVLIRVAFSGICGSELGGYLGHNSLRVPPLVMGHEFSGEIAALGDGATMLNPALAAGQRVTVNPLIHNPNSRPSKRGQPHLCPQRQIIGIHRPGSYAGYVTAPAAYVYPIPDAMSFEMAALTEPMGCAIRAASLAQVQPTDCVLITGLGPIGLLILQVVQAAGARHIIATDTDPNRRAMGQHFGVQVLDPTTDDVVAAARDATDGEGVDAAIDAVGADATRRECIDAVRPGGRVVWIGLHAEESAVQANWIIRQEINVQGSFAYTPVDFENALAWLADSRIEMADWIVKAPLAEGGDCFERLLGEPGAVAKILLY